MPKIPDVSGKLEEEARTELINSKFEVGLRSEAPSANVVAGHVIRTTPLANEEAAEGSEVAIEVSTGSAKVKVPDVTGKSEKEARALIESAGLVVGAITHASDPAVAAEAVVFSIPVKDVQVDPGSTVALMLSSGPAKVKVPDLAGKSEAEARAMLAAANLRVGDISSDSHATVASGSIIKSTPAAGAEVASGSPVALTISTGSPLIEVPDVSGLAVATARRVLQSSGLELSKETRQYTDQMPKGAVLASGPRAGAMVSPGSLIALEVSDGLKPDWAQYVVPTVLTSIGAVVVVAIFYALFSNNQQFLMKLADRQVARGLITFLIAISTVGIAIILAVSTVVSAQTADDDRRFDRGKQVLTILIGVLGTIVGFYFGSSTDNPQQTPRIQISLPAAGAGKPYVSAVPLIEGLTPPVEWTVDPALPADLLLDGMTGQVSGTPKAPKEKTKYTFKAVDSANPPNTLEQIVEFEVQ